MIGVCYKILKKDKEAFEWYDQAVTGYQQAGDLVGVGNTQRDIGIMHEYYQRHEKALEWLIKSEHTLQDTADRNAYGITLAKIGHIYTELGDLEKAEMYLKDGLNEIKHNPQRSWFFEMTTLFHLAALAFKKEDLESAASFLRQALGILLEEDQLGQQTRRVGQIFSALAWYYLKKKEPNNACKRFVAAMEAWQEMDAEGQQVVFQEMKVEKFLNELEKIDKQAAETARLSYEDII
jgi:tetratricopeptide (TPR) repeat protein